jgi:hypothetical protein
MGFYLRKGFNFGPLRLKLSRSGLGASFGVKGARIGVGPRGSYIHMGCGGLYYRQTLNPGRSTDRWTALPTTQHVIPGDNLQEISSKSALGMADSSADLLAELNRVKKRTARLPIVLLVGAIVVRWSGLVGADSWFVTLALLATIVAALYARHGDVLNGTAILNYSLEGEAAQTFEKLQAPFRQLATCQLVWHINAAGHADAKRNAGATTNLQRTEVRPSFSRPPRVQCTIEVPTLKAGRTTPFFFPDRLLVYDSAGVGAVAYLS